MNRTTRPTPVLGFGLLLAVVSALAVRAEPGSKVGTPVLDALAREERVRVLVYLSPPRAPFGDLRREMSAITALQDAVLSRLPAEEFLLSRRFQVVPAVAGEITAAGIGRLGALSEVLRIDLDEGGSGHLAQAVPMINADDLHVLGYTGEGVTVAIVDSGVDTDHPDLGDDLVAQACFCSGGGGCCPSGASTQFGAGAAEDDNGHGSNVAGVVTSRGMVAPTGVAPDAAIVAVKVLDAANGFSTTSDIVAALDWIAVSRPDVDVVNMSLGTFALYTGACDGANASTLALAWSINRLRDNGTIAFASSGNEASGTAMGAPACVGNTVSVGAVYDASLGQVAFGVCVDASTAADQVTCFSNSNPTTDLFAPGGAMTSAYLFGATSTYYGTSQASPTAAGCAALLRQAVPTLSPGQIETALESTGVSVTDATNGLQFPRVDCLAALASLQIDTDGDGVNDVVDNCVQVANPAQDNADGDPRGDVCDPCPLDPLDDADADGVCVPADNCPTNGNAGQENADGDAQGDVCDPCPLDALNDGDADGFCADLDNCPTISNPAQRDWDQDDSGNPCDADPEGDGVAAPPDNCPVDVNPNQRDRDGDGIGDLCDQILTVDDDGPAQFTTIQVAINAASSGDIVAVSAGTYAETLVAASGVDIIGSGPGVTTVTASGVYDVPVVAIVDLADGVRLSGFTLTGAQVAGGSYGGGVRIVRSTVEVDGNLITGNVATFGGGIYLEGAPDFVQDFAPVITNNLIHGNQAMSDGGGIAVYYGDAGWTFKNNTVVQNDSQANVGGVLLGLSGGVEFSDNIVAGNTSFASLPGVGMTVAGAPSVVFSNNDFFGNPGGDFDPPAQNPVGQYGNLSVDPGFVAPGTGGFALTVASALVDAGSFPGLSHDLHRVPRPLEGNGPAPARGDIGALERVPDDADQDGIANGEDVCPFVPDPAQPDADSDGVGDVCDTCPAEGNPGQRDLDGDGVGDVCDNCPVVLNPDQADTNGDDLGDACIGPDGDADGVGDAADCAPADPAAFSVPPEVGGLRVSGRAPTAVAWTPVVAGVGTGYDLVTGALLELRSDGGYAGAICLAGSVAPGSYADVRPAPGPGSAFYYLVRAANVCGDGTFGQGSADPDPRDHLDAPATSPCP